MTFFNTLSLFLHRKQWLHRDDDGDDKKKMDTSKINRKQMATRSESSVDMIEEAYIDYITPKTQTTMRNENKCFFSVSLENGFTITGENPQQVYFLLLRLKHALLMQYELETEDKLEYSAEETLRLWRILNNASETIENHINIMED